MKTVTWFAFFYTYWKSTFSVVNKSLYMKQVTGGGLCKGALTNAKAFKKSNKR